MESKQTVFVIEDVPEMANLVAMYLEKNNIHAEIFHQAEDALECLKTKTPDLFILDLNLPGMSGFEFLDKIKKELKITAPVIIVSARDADDDIIKGLKTGADEFVTKPFSPGVLVARVQACLRRIAETSAAAAEETINFGEYTLMLNSCVLKKGPARIPLSSKEYAVLELLAKNNGDTVTPEKIYSQVWQTSFGDITAVAVYIQRLRKKLEKDPASPEYIKTVFGRGYKFCSGDSKSE